jgi:two-component system response regulator YesN
VIRVMIVDDEPHIIRRLTRYIEQNEKEFEIVATAPNGRRALELLVKTPVDVLFTDIRMPIMDGVELLKRVDEQYSGIVKVVLSGYDEFYYAADALRANAKDYLLKPVVEKQLKELFEKLRTQASSARHERVWYTLRTLVDGGPEGACDANTLNDRFTAALFCAGNIPLSTSCELSASARLWEDTPMERTADVVCGGELPERWVFTGTTPSERIVLARVEAPVPIAALFEALRGHGVAVSVIYDAQGMPARVLPDRLPELRKRLYAAMRIGKSQLLSADVASVEPECSTETAVALARTIMRGGGSGHSDELFTLFEREDWTEAQIADALTLALAQNRHGDSRSVDDTLRMRGAILDAIGDAFDLADLKQSLQGLFSAMPRQGQEDLHRMKAVADYLDRHYADSITTQTLAAEFGYVPGYLSLLFRREYGFSPADYLQKVRIEHAKEILTRESGVLVKDVAFRVGFKNQFHFSKIFKSLVGVQPSEYQ